LISGDSLPKFLADPGLVIRHWPGEDSAMVFDPRSSSTHLVDSLAGELLAATSGQAHTVATLLQALGVAEDAGMPMLPSELHTLDVSLQGLLDVGLLRTVP
jgi:PqqD family protein of HPr-rel-A system